MSKERRSTSPRATAKRDSPTAASAGIEWRYENYKGVGNMLFLAGLVLLIMTGFNPRYACIAFVTIAFIILGVAISITAKPHWMAHRKRPYNVYEHVDCDLWAEDLYEDFKEDWH